MADMGSEQFLRYLKFEKRYSEHTLRAYIADLEQFFIFCMHENPSLDQIANLNFKKIRQWIVELNKRGLSNRSINRKLSSLKKYCIYLINKGELKLNPFDKIIAPKQKKRLPEFIKENEMNTLYQSAVFEANFAGIRDAAIIEILYGTGIRLSELVNIKSSDIDFSSCTIKVKGKRNKERIVPFPKEIIPNLKAYENIKKEHYPTNEYFFITEKGQQAYPRLIQRIVSRYLATVCANEKISPHVLRHTYATHLLNNGAEINAIKELLGHANLSATQVYTHNTFQKLNKIYKLAHPRA